MAGDVDGLVGAGREVECGQRSVSKCVILYKSNTYHDRSSGHGMQIHAVGETGRTDRRIKRLRARVKDG